MSLEPITRMEAILAGEDITPLTRKEYFTKEAVDNASGGSSLPSVTSADNGDVLTVVEGVWSKAAPSGGKFVVTLTEDPETHTWSADKSVEDCIAAYESGKTVVCLYPLMESYIELPCYYADSHYGAITFSKTVKTDGEYLYFVSGLKEGGSDEWDASETALGGGSSKFVVTLTEDTSGGEPVYTADKSVDECIEAYEEGKEVECLLHLDDGQIVLNLVYALSQYHAIAFSNAATIHSATLFEVAGVLDGSSDNWAVKQTPLGISSTYKPTYSFAFTVTVDQSDPTQYVCTPASGVTYAAIQAALSETDNVYAVATLPDGGVLKALFNNIDSTGVAATNVFYTGSSFSAYRVLVQSDDSCDLAIKALANA